MGFLVVLTSKFKITWGLSPLPSHELCWYLPPGQSYEKMHNRNACPHIQNVAVSQTMFKNCELATYGLSVVSCEGKFTWHGRKQNNEQWNVSFVKIGSVGCVKPCISILTLTMYSKLVPITSHEWEWSRKVKGLWEMLAGMGLEWKSHLHPPFESSLKAFVVSNVKCLNHHTEKCKQHLCIWKEELSKLLLLQ